MHVADAWAPNVEAQVAAVREVLGRIGAGGIPEVLALNKADLLSEVERARVVRRFPEGVPVSALTGEGLEELTERVAEDIPRPPVEATFLVPFGREDVVARLYREGEVLDKEVTGEGTRIRARVEDRDLAAFGDLVVEGSSRRRPR